MSGFTIKELLVAAAIVVVGVTSLLGLGFALQRTNPEPAIDPHALVRQIDKSDVGVVTHSVQYLPGALGPVAYDCTTLKVEKPVWDLAVCIPSQAVAATVG